MLLNQEEANAGVMKLMNDLGFDAVGAGALDESWHQQPGTPVCGADHDSEGVRRALSQASSQRPPQFQATTKVREHTRSTLEAGAISKGVTKAGCGHQTHRGDRAIQGLGLGLGGSVGG